MNDKKPEYKSHLLDFTKRTPVETIERSKNFLDELRRRRTVRHYSDEPVPREALVNCIETAAQAPSGANKQPWTFVLVTDPEIKSQIRIAAEKEEHEHYHNRAPESWLRDLAPLGTDEHKPFLETAPALIVIFAQKYGDTRDEQHYYVNESVGIATGFLLAALHNAGFATLTHTPSPMKFLAQILGRPENERAYLLIPVGYPADDCEVPKIIRKDLSEVMVEK
jgi:iodotyrosine deiodinase